MNRIPRSARNKLRDLIWFRVYTKNNPYQKRQMKKISCTPISSPKNKQWRKNNPKTLRLKSTTKIAYLEVADRVQWGMQYCEASHERV
jgi:hypothetical protein